MAPARAPRAAARALGLLLLALLLPLRPADAQGLKRSQDNLLGSSSSYKSLQALQASSQAFKSQFKANRKSACGDKAGSLCASKASIDETAALTVATSPPRFDARDPKDTGGAVLASPVRDQGACFSCTAFAVTGAAEAAVSAALGKDASARKWSVQDLHFCLSKSDGESKSCRSSASSVLDVLKPFVSSPRSLVLEACLPYTAPDAPLDDDLCQTQCSDVDPDLKAGGKFEYVQLNSAWEVQQHIRTWGAAITRLDIYDDFKPFFEKTPGGVYAGPGRGAKFLEGHAVLLVGYDANKGAYLIKNSWGPEFGQGGYAWVSFAGGEKVGIGALADTYGLRFRPTAAAPLPYTYSPGPKPDCVAVALPIGTWLSTIAQQLRLPIRKLLVDNLDTITDLEKPLDPSKPLMVCGAPPAMIARMRKGAPPPPPPPAPKPAPAAGGGAAEESVAPARGRVLG
ncbi:MAG: hypothetical protein J3K34DRAFT_254243 [Monoraphidium minutum]|nr:MAG: hypothetical protein J3K34DRAFT_254243 [Monoraphidium minutum]